ncbi:MAG: hypothetical protein Ct9H300mP1_22280 [Planctomycetaceae bacterium]|nr:MAG: hypothetical protein Ct9H300mP1_22280 [Planctomycetaceae bacterium]
MARSFSPGLGEGDTLVDHQPGDRLSLVVWHDVCLVGGQLEVLVTDDPSMAHSNRVAASPGSAVGEPAEKGQIVGVAGVGPAMLPGEPDRRRSRGRRPVGQVRAGRGPWGRRPRRVTSWTTQTGWRHRVRVRPGTWRFASR